MSLNDSNSKLLIKTLNDSDQEKEKNDKENKENVKNNDELNKDNNNNNKNDKKIDDVSKFFNRVKIMEKISDCIFYINLIVSGITIIEFEYQNLFFILNIVFSITYVVLTNVNDIYFKNVAENERRKSFIKDSFDVDITKRVTHLYYNNEEHESVRRMGVDCFENLFFTKFITKKMLATESIKVFIILILYIVLLIQVKNLELMVLITQTVFSSEYLFKYIKFIYFKIHVTRIYSKLYDMFITFPIDDNDKMKVKILDATMDYECLKFFCKIPLSTTIYNKYREKLNKGWNDLYQKHMIKNHIEP